MKSITYYHKEDALSRTFLLSSKNKPGRVQKLAPVTARLASLRREDLYQETDLCDLRSEGSNNRRLGTIKFPAFMVSVLPRPV